MEQASWAVGGSRTLLGTKGACRFCGESKPETSFKNKTHTFPEFLGNKTVFSLNECDACNKLFSRYEDALAQYVQPYLTLGGVQGKDNKIPKTGRTRGPSTITQTKGDIRNISLSVTDGNPADYISVDPRSRTLKFRMPVAKARFVPRHAYKALCKMGVALLPEEELANYQKLLSWLQDADDQEDFQCLEVVVSYTQIGNPPPLVHGTLIRRIKATEEVPYIVFLLAAGPLCFQIDLMSDNKENHLGPVPMGCMKINWTTILGGGASGYPPMKITYSRHQSLNWASRALEKRNLKQVEFAVKFE